MAKPPETPSGYRPGYVFQYPKLALQLAAAGTFVVVAPLFLVVAWLLRGGASGAAGLPVDLSGVWVFGVAVATIVTHEAVHGLAMRYLGYRPSFGFAWRMLAAYAVAPGQLQRRGHALAIALAPLAALDAVALPLLALTDRVLITAAFVALVVNTVGSVGDLYFARRLLGLPRGALVCDVDPSTVLVFEPVVPAKET